jgi:hypothetical protein
VAFSREWNEILNTVADSVGDGGACFFRGQEWEGWGLVPALGRLRRESEEELRARETRLFADFRIHAGNLLTDEDDAWRIAFLMQHHGLPTRLLDWSASFAIALHFALRRVGEADAVVWMLDAAKLNRAVGCGAELLLHSELEGNYHDYFIARAKEFPFPVVGLAPSRSSPRLQQQRGFFTLHRDLGRPLDETHPQVLRKVVIPAALFDDARAFLRLSGVNEFALFPDLDGLARHLRVAHGLE